MFPYPPTPHVLQWLSNGQFASRFHRTVRLWVLLHSLYGTRAPWSATLPDPFSYGDVRDRLFAPGHPTDETLKAHEIVDQCVGTQCVCGRSLWQLIFTVDSITEPDAWMADTAHLTGLSPEELNALLDDCPFATVHRSIRDDLKLLGDLGWLTPHGRGKFSCRLPAHWPTSPPDLQSDSPLSHLSDRQLLDIMHGLEAIAFVQPSLEPIIQTLWEHLHTPPIPPLPHRTALPPSPPPKRIFIDFDYILTEDARERVDTLQSEIEDLWQHSDGGVIQFDYWLAKAQQICQPTVYPVCLHYTRRAKYLSAYGVDPNGAIAWHNYRLDRIRSSHLIILAWGDPAVPKALRLCRNSGTLPTPDQVRMALDEAWGFDFYREKKLLLIRFSPRFAQEYVDNTLRHPTFRAIAYNDIPDLVRHQISDPMEQAHVLGVLQAKSETDVYYRGWIRVGDTNVTMRLRDWRPNGEVISPFVVRQTMMREAEQELMHYET